MRVLGAPSAPRPRTSDGSPSMAATACWTASASSRRRPFIGRPTAFLDIELCPLRRGGPQVPPGRSSRCSLCLYRSLNIGVPPNPIFGEIYMMPAGTPILVLKEGTRRERGKGAQFNNIAAAKAVADAVRSTLGPRGMDKMLVDSLGDVVITNDGVTILKEIDIEHPAAKMLVEVAKTQDEEAGDGTTTAVVLAGELLKRAEDLIEQNIHPTVIAAGYRQAADKAREVLEKVAMKISVKDLDTLKKVAMTAMSSKSASGHKELLADVSVKAVTTVAEQRADGTHFVDDDNIQIVKKQGGSIADTELVDGIIVDKERVPPGMPSEVKEGKIALVDAALEVKKTEIDAKIEITDPNQLQAFLNEEEGMQKRMDETVRKSGENVLYCQKGIDDTAQHCLTKQEIYALRRFKKSNKEQLKKHAGVNVFTGKVTDMKKENVLEPIRVGTQAVSSATDAAVMVLRIDDVIAARSGGGAGGAGGPKGGEGGEGGGDGEDF